MVSSISRPVFRALMLGAACLATAPGRLAAQGAGEPGGSAPALYAAPLAEIAPPDRWLGADKPVHALAGWWVGAAAYGAAAAANGDPAERRLAATVASLAAGVAKETFDAAVQGEPFSWRDLTAGALGLAAFLVLTVAAES